MLKYKLMFHLNLHHGCKVGDFSHREKDVLNFILEHPEFSPRVEVLFDQLCKDLHKLAEEFDGEI